MKKWFKRILFTLLGIVLLLGILFYAFYKRFVIEAPSITYTQVSTLKEEQLQDLDYLSRYITVDKSFDTDRKRHAFLEGIDHLKKQVPLTTAAFEMQVAALMSISNNTHTNVHPSRRARRLNAIPLRFYWFEEGLYVVMAQKEHKHLLGKRIKKINGFEVVELVLQLEKWFGGSAHRLKFFSPLFLMSPELMDAVHLGTDSTRLNLEFYDANTILIAASETAKDKPGYWPQLWLNPSAATSEAGWFSLAAHKATALPFQHLHQNVWHQFTDRGVYVQVNENVDTETVKVSDYLNAVAEEAKEKKLAYAVLDLRFNSGGDYHMVRPFIAQMESHLEGKGNFYVILGNGTFSAGIITAALAKHTFGSKTKFVGEAVGDALQFWADGGSPFILPNSKIQLRIWTAYHDWKNGCTDWRKCFWITLFDGVAVNHLDLDQKIPLRFQDFISGKDTALDHIIASE